MTNIDTFDQMQIRPLLAMLVHAYTASGAVLTLLAVLAIGQGDWRQAMMWLMLCFVIDGTDGMLARKVKVSEVLPNFNGRDIDFVVDFLSYAFVPAYFIYASGLLPESAKLIATAFILIISGLYYGRQGMVTESGQFRGFPVLWNLVAFYEFFVFGFDPWINVLLILVLGIGHFLPIQISYPTKNLSKSKWPAIIGFLMLGVLLSILYFYPEKNTALTIAAWSGLLYFAGLTIKHTWLDSRTPVSK